MKSLRFHIHEVEKGTPFGQTIPAIIGSPLPVSYARTYDMTNRFKPFTPRVTNDQTVTLLFLKCLNKDMSLCL